MFGAIDVTLVVIYLIVLMLIGHRFLLRSKNDVDEYLLMGRRLAMPGFVASLVSTWYGGILGVGEYSYKYGLANWVVFGLPYYIGAILFAMFLARKARRSMAYTIPDQLEKSYGRKTSLAGAFLVFFTTIPAAYVLQVGLLAQTIFDIPLAWGVFGGAFFSIFYVFTGGLRNDVITDRLQFVLMFSGFIIMLVFLYTHFGGLEFIRQKVPSQNLTWHGGKPLPYILAWYFIALGTLVDPSFYQRCFAAKSEAVAQRGIFIAIGFWAFFDFMTTSTGLYAQAIVPELVNPATAYPVLAAKILPDTLRAVFLLGLLATVMSTVDSFTLISGQTFGKDFIHKLWGGNITTLTRIGLVVAGIAGSLVAILKQSVVSIWYDFGSISTASLMIPLAASFSARWRMRPNFAFIGTIVGGTSVIFWKVFGYIGHTDRFPSIDAIYPGLACSVAIFILDHLTKRETR